jgi:hypothetical protein
MMPELSSHELDVLWEAGLPRDCTDYELLRRWHDDHHEGQYQVCPEQPCHALNARHHWRRWGHL